MKYSIGSLIVIVVLTLTGSLAAISSPTKQRQAPADVVDPTIAELKEMSNVEFLSRWMTYYYLHPRPELMVAALLLADKQGLLQGDTAAPLQAFTSRVFSQNPEKVKEWFTKIGPMSENGKTMVLTAIWWSNTKEGKSLLEAIASGLTEKSKIEFHKQIDSPPPEIENMDIASPDVLDMLWACFSATGDTKYVKRLMSTLLWGQSDSKDLPRMLMASAARWSLISNINQHPRVKEFCESTEKLDANLKPYLEKLLAEAATASAKAEKDKQEALTEKEKATNAESEHKAARKSGKVGTKNITSSKSSNVETEDKAPNKSNNVETEGKAPNKSNNVETEDKAPNKSNNVETEGKAPNKSNNIETEDKTPSKPVVSGD